MPSLLRRQNATASSTPPKPTPSPPSNSFTGPGSFNPGARPGVRPGARSGGCQFCVADNDARVQYIGPWTLRQGNNSNTIHETTTIGSSILFSFNGSGIVVIGTVPQSNTSSPPPESSFTIDGGEAVIINEPFADARVPKQPLFSATQLSGSQEHTLLINVTNAQDAPFIFDNFLVFPTFNNSRSFVNPKANGTSSSAPQSSATGNASPANNSFTDHTARILFIVFGVVFLLLLGLIVFLFWRLNFHKRQSEKQKLPVTIAQPPPPSKKGGDWVSFLTSPESIYRNNPSIMYGDSDYGGRSEYAGPSRRLSPIFEKRFSV